MREKEIKIPSRTRCTQDQERHQNKAQIIPKCSNKCKLIPPNKEIEQSINETNSNSKFKNNTKKPINKILNSKSDLTENEHVTNHGSLKQYCVKGSEVLLRDVHYLKNEKSRMLMITVDDKEHQTDTYSILSTKDVCPFTFKDRNAFVLKVLDINKKLKSMTFQTLTEEEKKNWINKYSLNMSLASDLLNICIKEVEKRRFQLGVKKRSEQKSKMKVDADSLVDLMDDLVSKKEIHLNNDSKWTVGNLERLIQVLLNELLQPLINFNAQRNLRKIEQEEVKPEVEARFVLSSLATVNRAMLTVLLNHMERLSKYYLIVMSSPKKILPQIRKNICRRLSPIIFRIQHDLENEAISTKCNEILYNIMMIINDTAENYE